MSLPLGRLNGSVAILDNLTEVALGSGFTGTMANNAGLTGADIKVGGACTLLVLAKLSAGALTIKVDNFVPGATHDFSSPAKSLTISGTNEQYIPLDLQGSNLGFAISLTAGGSGATITELVVMLVYEKKSGEGWHDEGSAQNAELSSVVLDTLGSSSTGLFDGKALLGRGPAVSHVFE